MECCVLCWLSWGWAQSCSITHMKRPIVSYRADGQILCVCRLTMLVYWVSAANPAQVFFWIFCIIFGQKWRLGWHTCNLTAAFTWNSWLSRRALAICKDTPGFCLAWFYTASVWPGTKLVVHWAKWANKLLHPCPAWLTPFLYARRGCVCCVYMCACWQATPARRSCLRVT